MKVKAEIFKGIEFVKIDELPEEQRGKLVASLDQDLFIKILIDGKIIRNCIQYSEYELWFDNEYPSSSPRKIAAPVPKVKELV